GEKMGLDMACRAFACRRRAVLIRSSDARPESSESGAMLQRSGEGRRTYGAGIGGAEKKFGSRVEAILVGEQTAKGEWGVLVVDEKSGEVLLSQNADRYFVPASNMKLFTTALALATLGPEYKFRTTLEALVGINQDGKLDGNLYLVGRGDPNLSSRK